MRLPFLIILFAIVLLMPGNHLKALGFNCFEQDVDVNAKDETGLTPLIQAAQDGGLKEMKALLEKGANVNLTDQYGWTALIYSIAKQDSSKIKLLLESSPDVNTKDRRGITPLMWAALGGKPEIVKLLLSKGADVNAITKNGATALSFAIAKGHDNIAQLLKKAGGRGPQIDKANVPEWLTPVDQAPKILNPKAGIPAYTEEARRRGVQGIVRLRILFGTDGIIKRIKVISGLPYGLTEEAIRAASRLTATPAMNDGQPIEYWLASQLNFNIG